MATVAERFTFENSTRLAFLGLEMAMEDPKRRKTFVDGCYKTVLTGMLGIAGSLEKPDYRAQLFGNVLDKVQQPLLKVNAMQQEVVALFKYLRELSTSLAEQQDLAWQKFVSTIGVMLTTLSQVRQTGVPP
eukprot:TRINITY_DN3091_c0_g1_i2.p2 TRINITY_DN3091_c0_g1~~TRINITY_DN3091_c0_g1_i2.p2  ORF type:complete len:131 (+),score=35.62 TRINITY_DN3091_c0_g1_i2:272-664(+)